MAKKKTKKTVRRKKTKAADRPLSVRQHVKEFAKLAPKAEGFIYATITEEGIILGRCASEPLYRQMVRTIALL